MMDWDVVSLSDMCSKIFAGGDVPKGNYSKFKTDEYSVPIFANGEKNKGLYGYTNIEKVITPSITVSARGTIGYSEIRHEPFYPIVRLIVLSPNLEVVELEFLKYIIQSIDFINSGSSIPQLTVPMIKDYKSTLPSIPEQKRIVAILDQAFADIEQARAKTEQNLKNARELFESSLQEVFKSQGENWERVSLLELLDRKWITSHLDGNHGGDYPKKSEFVDSGVPYISAKCVIDGEINMSKAKYLTKERAGGLRKGIAKNEDVLFAHNATVGPVTILKTDEEKVILGTSLTYYRCNKDFILPEYLAQYMVSYEFTSQYTSIMRQSTRNQVPITKQREFIHVVPPIEQQADIAKSLIELSSQLKRLELIYHQKLSALNELKKSILQKAFTGELTKNANNKNKGVAA